MGGAMTVPTCITFEDVAAIGIVKLAELHLPDRHLRKLGSL
jgi:hypothetical protein